MNDISWIEKLPTEDLELIRAEINIELKTRKIIRRNKKKAQEANNEAK